MINDNRVTCGECDGKGHRNRLYGSYTCPKCHGEGLVDPTNLKPGWLESAMKKEKKKKRSPLKVLNDFADEIYQGAKEHGFHDELEPDVPRYIANLHGEISEIWEAYRKSSLNKLCDKSDKMKELGLEPLTCAEEEIADILIRTLDTAKSLGVDIEKALINKHKYNQSRSYKHGGKLA